MTNEIALDKGRRRGRRALYAGVFLILLVGFIWIWIDRIFAGNATAFSDASSMRLLGRLNVGFALLMIAGLMGSANGWLMMRSGKANIVLIVGLVIIAISAFFTIAES